MRSVLYQPAETYLGVTELPLDYPERMLDLGAHLSLGLLDLALGFVQSAALTQFLVRTTADRDLSDHFPTLMFRTLLHAGVARIGADHILLTM